jgi:hypothetical protein
MASSACCMLGLGCPYSGCVCRQLLTRATTAACTAGQQSPGINSLRVGSLGLVEAISTQSPLLHTCVIGKAGTAWSPYSSGLQTAPSGLSTQHMEVGSPVALLQLQGSVSVAGCLVLHIDEHGSTSLSNLALICGSGVHALKLQAGPLQCCRPIFKSLH